MIIITIIFYYLVITVVLIIITSYLKRWLRKYIEKRINQSLELLNKLENINKELDCLPEVASLLEKDIMASDIYNLLTMNDLYSCSDYIKKPFKDYDV